MLGPLEAFLGKSMVIVSILLKSWLRYTLVQFVIYE